MELKKSYMGLIWFLVVFMAVGIMISLLPTEDAGLISRLICAEMTCGMALLTYVVYRTEYVYWYNGVTYEEAVKAGSQRRKAYARKHFERFAACAAVCLLYSSAAHALGWPLWIDIIISGVAEIATALSTVKIKL